MLEWTYKGVDFNLPGNGGQDCVNFIPLWQRISESGLACVFAACSIAFAYSRVRLPEKVPSLQKTERCGKRILLVTMCLTFGIELGFKIATNQIIYLLNPCHLTTMIQIYILAAPPSRHVTALFRMHLHMLTGAPIAIIFPVINTRLLPFETEIYFIQHILMMIIPYYLMRIGGVYKPEKLSDMSWAFLSLGWLYFFYFVPLNYLAVASHVNLNNMLCPAISDPFYGRLYRICAMIHQLLALPLVGKFVVATAQCLKIGPSCEIHETLVFMKEKETGKGREKGRMGSNANSDNENHQKINSKNGTENGSKTQYKDQAGIGKNGDFEGQQKVRNGHLKTA